MNLSLLSELDIDHLIYIGISELDGEQLKLIKTIPKVTFFDADEERCEFLKGQIDEKESITIYQKVVSLDGGLLPWYQYNLSNLNGITSIEEIKNDYPGLVVTAKNNVDTISFTDALKLAKVVPNETSLLVFDIPYLSQTFFDAWLKLESQLHLSHLLINGLKARFQENKIPFIDKLNDIGWQYELTSKFIPSNNVDYQPLFFSKNQLANVVKEKCQTQKEELTAYQKQLGEQAKNLQLLTQECNELQNKLENVEQEKVNVEQQKNKQNEQIETIQTEVNNKTKQVEELKSHSQSQKVELEDKQQNLNEQSEKLNSITQEHNELKQHLTEAKQEKTKAEELIVQQHEQIQTLQIEVNNRTKDIEDLKNIKVQLESDQSIQIKKLEEVDAQNNELQKQKDNLKELFEAQQQNNEELIKQIGTLTEQLGNEQIINDKEKQTIVQFKSEVLELTKQLDSVKSDLSERDQSAKNFEQERNKARKERDSARAEREEFKENLEKLQKQFLAKENLLNQKLIALSDAKKVNSQLIAENKTLHNQIQKLQKLMNKAEAQLEVIKAFLKP